ncbi:MAG: glycoside hydrolase family 88 protein [Lapillicoccus sp.]
MRDRVASAGYAAMAYWYYRWDWGEAIALDGLLAAGRAYTLPAFTSWVGDEVTEWIAREAGGGAAAPNVLGPGVALLDVLESGALGTREERAGWDLAERLAAAVTRASEGTGALTPEADRRMVFVDSLYGVPEFLVRFADATQDAGLVATTTELVAGHCRALQRPDGLFAHVADLDDPSAQAIAWGRGNGWAALGLARLLSVLGARADGELVDGFVLLAEALRHHQEPGGRLRNLIDDEHSYPEASTTSMVSAAFASGIHGGRLPARFGDAAEAGWGAVADRIDTSGALVGVSYRPGVNSDPRRYEHTPVVGAYPWGQGPYLLAASQVRSPGPR